MDVLLMREEPMFRKCCFFLPLRLCLQTWALFKVVVDALAMSYLTFVMVLLYRLDERVFIRQLSFLHLLGIMVLGLLVDVGFLVALISGTLRKSFATLRIFYYYEFYAMTAEAVVIAIVCVIILQDNNSVSCGVTFGIVGVLYILLDLCIIVTVKSEMIKLRNKEQYDFSRMPVTKADVEGTKFRCDEE